MKKLCWLPWVMVTQLQNSIIAHQFSGKPNQISKSHNTSHISSKGAHSHSLVYGCLVRSLPWESWPGKHIQPQVFKITFGIAAWSRHNFQGPKQTPPHCMLMKHSQFNAKEAGNAMPSMVTYHSTTTTISICTICVKTRNLEAD